MKLQGINLYRFTLFRLSVIVPFIYLPMNEDGNEAMLKFVQEWDVGG